MREALKLALECAERCENIDGMYSWSDTISAIKDALAQPEQEPVALETVYETIIQWDEGGGKRSRRELARRIASLYTTPPTQPSCSQRQCNVKPWVSLSDEDIERIAKKARSKDHAITLAMRELKEKNT